MPAGFIKALINIIYPAYCLLCAKKIDAGSRENIVCQVCLRAIVPNRPPFCVKCGRQLKVSNFGNHICRECRLREYHFDRAWGCYPYKGSLRSLIHNFKYKNKVNLKNHLSELMINFILDYRLPVSHCDYIIPIPLSKSKLREREFNQSELLSEKLSAHLKRPMIKNNLTRIRNTRTQMGLDAGKRWQNMRNAFMLKDKETIKGKNILIVDDVLTTGATASEAARVLKESGAGVVFVLTLAN